jgi:hypothetical protein
MILRVVETFIEENARTLSKATKRQRRPEGQRGKVRKCDSWNRGAGFALRAKQRVNLNCLTPRLHHDTHPMLDNRTQPLFHAQDLPAFPRNLGAAAFQDARLEWPQEAASQQTIMAAHCNVAATARDGVAHGGQTRAWCARQSSGACRRVIGLRTQDSGCSQWMR